MHLSPMQRKFIVCYLICIVIICAYVPWQRVHPDNPAFRRSMGYSLIWKIPTNGSAIDYGKIGLEFLGISAVAGIVCLIAKDKQ